MKYTFNIVGVSPILYFFEHQQQNQKNVQPLGVEYIGTHKCTLDSLLNSVETVPVAKRDWKMDEVVDTVIQFWLHNSDVVNYWKSRLDDAGRDSLLVARVADIQALRNEFEFLLHG
jgi:hypothetical protein